MAITQDRRTHKTRMKIYNLIEEHPGLHLSRIAEVLDMSAPLAEYHLLNMIKNNLVIDVKDEGGHYKRFYIKDSDVNSEQIKQLAVLRQKSLLHIVMLLLKHRHLLHKEMLANLEIAPSTLSYHLNKLIENGIVEVVPYGREKGYELTNEDEMFLIIGKYKLYSVVEEFKDIWKDLNVG